MSHRFASLCITALHTVRCQGWLTWTCLRTVCNATSWSMYMDLGTLGDEIAKDEQGAVITIYQKNGDPYKASDGTDATVTVVGSESTKYRAARDEITRDAMNRAPGRRTKLEPADLRKNRVMLATASITDWSGWEDKGRALPCTPANLAILLTADHILEQVEAGIANHADFFVAPSTTSSTT